MKKTIRTLLAMIIALAMLTTFVAAEEAIDVEAISVEDEATVEVEVTEKSAFDIHWTTATMADFADAPPAGNWDYQGLNCAVGNEVMKGHNGLLRPSDSLTRAEMITMMVRVLGAQNYSADVSKYIDLDSSAWYYSNIQSGVAIKIINGSGNRMMPNDPITREQTFTILARTFLFTENNDSAINSFNDYASVSDWANDATNALVEARVVRGDKNNELRPKSNVTRAEFATMLDRIVCYFAKADMSYAGKEINGSVIINDANTDLSGATINGDVYIVEKVGEGAKIDLSDVDVNGRVVIREGDVVVAEDSTSVIVRIEDVIGDDEDVTEPEKPSQGGTSSTVSGSTPSGNRPSGEGAVIGEGTYITYSYAGAEVKRFYADVANNVVTFDFAKLLAQISAENNSAADPTQLIFKKLYVEADKKMKCSHDLISFYSNVETSLADMLVDIAGATNNVLVPITNEGTSLAELYDKMDEAYADNLIFPELFDELNIEVISAEEAKFHGFIGSADFTFCMKV